MADGIFDKAKAIGSRGLKAGGDAVDGAAKFTRRNRTAIADGTRRALDATGKVAEDAGQGLLGICSEVAQPARAVMLPDDTSSRLVAARDLATGYTMGAGRILGRSLDAIGGAARRISPAIGEATGGVVVGAMNAVSGTVDVVAIGQADFDAAERRLAAAGAEASVKARAEQDRIEDARRRGDRHDMLDALTIGGVTMAGVVANQAAVPADVEHAFELAYPDLAASGQSFGDAAERMSADGLVGLVSGVKGKLFELELIDQFNQGALADGLHAEIAASATQPGYDILIRDAHGNAVDVLQAKAAESVAYVRDALERYPNIDIATTSEVHGRLMEIGLAGDVIDSGISNDALQQKVEAAAGLGHHLDAADFIPSALGLAIIAVSAFGETRLSWEARSAAFGDRVGKAGIAGFGAQAVLVATGTWWLALAGGIGMRVMAGRGDAKRRRLDALVGIVESMEAGNRRHVRRGRKVAGSGSAAAAFTPAGITPSLLTGRA